MSVYVCMYAWQCTSPLLFCGCVFHLGCTRSAKASTIRARMAGRRSGQAATSSLTTITTSVAVVLSESLRKSKRTLITLPAASGKRLQQECYEEQKTRKEEEKKNLPRHRRSSRAFHRSPRLFLFTIHRETERETDRDWRVDRLPTGTD